MKVFVLLQHWNPYGYGASRTSILKIYTYKRNAEDHLKRLKQHEDFRYSIQEHLIMTKILKEGDRVRYSSTFCRTIGAVTGFTPQARGVITRLWGKGEFAEIVWDFPDPEGKLCGGAHISALERLK